MTPESNDNFIDRIFERGPGIEDSGSEATDTEDYQIEPNEDDE